MIIKKNKKVFVGLSGGVDSSVSAALLKKEGYDVTGVFIKVWSPEWMPCVWRKERRDAMRVAARLDIPFITLDLEKEYKRTVVDYMVAEYKAGRVPNPDVMCNKQIKFGAFFKFALENGADLVATGHYAILDRRGGKNKNIYLLKGEDANKDQSYFLWTLTAGQLARTLFPIGHLTKTKVRAYARKFGLPTAEKKDSQGICFVGKVDMRDFLKHFINEQDGDVIDIDGNIIGSHDGAFFYTIGQRHGFVVTEKTINDKPYYVVGKDLQANTIIVSHNKLEPDFIVKELNIENTNWIVGVPRKKVKYTAILWYRGSPRTCTVSVKVRNSAVVLCEEPQNIAAGQSVVIYDGNICLGGGVAQKYN